MLPRSTTLLLTAANLFNYFERWLPAALLPILGAEFSLNHTQEGWLVAAFVLGYALSSPLFGLLGDRLHRPRLMAVGVVIAAFATTLSGLAGEYQHLFLLRILLGVGVASFITLAPGYFKDQNRDLLVLNSTLALFFAAIPVGSALGYVFGGQIAKYLSWQSAFVITGIPSFFLAWAVARLGETRRSIPERAKFLVAVKEVAAIPLLWFVNVGYVLNTFALNGIASFIVRYGVSIGFELEEIDFYFGIILVATGFIGTILGGRLSNYFSRRSGNPVRSMFWFITLSAFCGLPFVMGAFLVEEKDLFLGCCFVAELFIFAGTAPINSLIVLSSPQRAVAFSQGVTIFLINFFGALLGPMLVGMVADATTLAIGLQMTTIALLLCAGVWYVGTRWANSAASAPS